jgi:hypothetical protein
MVGVKRDGVKRNAALTATTARSESARACRTRANLKIRDVHGGVWGVLIE